MNVVAVTVFVIFFLLVTVLGFVAPRRRAADLGHLNEWGLGGDYEVEAAPPIEAVTEGATAR